MACMAARSGALNCSAAADWACTHSRTARQQSANARTNGRTGGAETASGDGWHLSAQVLNLGLPENDVRVASRALEHIRLGDDEEDLRR